MKRLHIATFGCRANHYDSEAVSALASAQGYQIVDDAADADVAVFNSCAVTAEAERDLRRAIRRTARANPRVRSVVMGCASALSRNATPLRALPTVSHLVAGADLDAMAGALEIEPGVTVEAKRQGTVRAVMRIQDGCDEHCTFCATTLARGANRSRTIDALVEEAAPLAQWHPEIVLTGTHIGTWGADIGLSLGALVAALVVRVPGVRFRLSSIEATEVDDALAEMLTSSSDRVAPHLHAPLQSGSDRVLRRMGRHWYTASSYADAIDRIAARCPVFGLGADVIAGFPGETDADFAETVSLVERLPFTYLHVFPYSSRPGTAATRLPHTVAPAVAKERARVLRDLADRKAASYRATRAGGVADVIAIGTAPERQGVTEDYLTVRLARAVPRGERFRARLETGADSLIAV